MTEEYPASAKVYLTENLGKLSILDMLNYFIEKGAMRVSDLHIKVGAPPTYRIDGNLVKLKGDNVDPKVASSLFTRFCRSKICKSIKPLTALTALTGSATFSFG